MLCPILSVSPDCQLTVAVLRLQLGFFQALKDLVEAAVNSNRGKPAVLVGHSMGCLVTLYFLSHQTQQWRSMYIAAFVSVSAPYLGSVTALKGMYMTSSTSLEQS